MGNSGIYVILNTRSSEAYIGSSIDLRRRQAHHQRRLRRGDHENLHLQHAWNKYGEAAFEFGVLEYLDDPEELHLAEQFWMDVYREENYELYNFGLAARTPWLGRKHTKETKRKISEAKKGKKRELFSQEWRDNLSKALKNPSEETRRKLSQAATGRPSSMKGRHHTEEARRKMREAQKNRPPASAETRRRIAVSSSRPYPAFVNRDTRKVIPTGMNLSAICRERGLNVSKMCAVKNGKRQHHKGWILLEVI